MQNVSVITLLNHVSFSRLRLLRCSLYTKNFFTTFSI